MKKTLYLYRLTDAKGDKRIVVVDDPSDDGIIYGCGNDGEFHQFESCEIYHAYIWAEKWGMKLQSGTMEIDVPDDIFTN